MISGILNIVNVVRHYLVMERLKECPTAHVKVKECPTAHVIQYSAGLLYEYDTMFTELCMIMYPPSSYCC